MLAHALLALMILTPTDQTVQVQKGTRLDITNFAGDINIKSWDKDAVRVEVNHSDREVVDIKPGDQVLTIRSRSTRGGPPRSLDYVVSVPVWMAITVGGTYTDVTMEGVGGDVSVETTRGDIKIRGGSGVVSLKSVQGEITLEKAKGRIEVRAVNESIRLADISGDLSAETTNGSIILDRIDSANVDLYTVNGNISYDGPIKDKGAYRLTTHNGMVAMAVPEKVNATLLVRTYNGGFRATFPLKLGDDQNPKKRFTLTLGNGSARVELESFGGTIALRRPGEPRPETERRHRREGDDKDKTGKDEAMIDRISVEMPDIHVEMPDIRVEMPDIRVEAPDVNVEMPDIHVEMPDISVEVQDAVETAIDEVTHEIGRTFTHDALGPVMDALDGLRINPKPHPVPRPAPRVREFEF